MPNKIILLDSNSLIHRAYHALPYLKSSKGQYTGAIFGFLTILLRLIKEQNPTHLAAAFDLKAPTFRHKMYEGYKATRKPMDEELRQQIEPLKSLLALMGIKAVSLQGYEGDDILGTLAKRFDDRTIIVTGDRDSLQLVSDSTEVFLTQKGVSEIEAYDVKRLAADGFTPDSFIDYKALRGDPSDNIPGIPGVGEKTAKQLIDKYGSLEKLFLHAGEIPGKVGEKICHGRESAFLSRALAKIDTDVPVECSLEEIAFKPVFSREVKRFLGELEIGALSNRMTFDDEADPSPKESVKTVCELKSVSKIDDALKDGDRISLYIDDNIRFSKDGKTEYSVSCVTDLFSEGVSFDESIEAVRRGIAGKELICYDYKGLSKTYGIEADKFFDVMIAAHLVRGSAPIKNERALFGSEGLQKGAAELYTMYTVFKRMLHENELDKLYYDVELPIAVVLRNMEMRGISVSVPTLERLKEKYTSLLDMLTSEIYSAAGCSFNIGSPKQLGEILFDKLCLPHGKKNKTGYSVDEEVLTALSDAHPIVPLLLKWRKYSKLLSTYVAGMMPLVVRGKIHTEFNQCITVTGRLSSTNPNLQNIPVRGDEARDIKSAFTASEGNTLVSADYSQIELRLLAHMSGDQKLIEAYNRADDIHAMTASQILGVPIDEVTPAQRREAKAINFGIIYGMSDFGLAENLSTTKAQAKAFIEKYFESYPTVKAYLDKNISDARERGYALTMLGRRRNLTDIHSQNYLLRTAAERMAMNTPLQGSATDIVKLAMLGVEKSLSGMRSKMILQIHDELIIDADKGEVEEVKEILKREMENAAALKVPLTISVSTADNWGDLK